MKSKMPEIVALILLIVSLLVPPWKVIAGVPDSGPVYYNEWTLIFEGPLDASIDVVLLLVELLVIAGIYFLLKLIFKPPKT
jgi:hypothetical protein